ncbi:MAG TPA: serpin family protein [Gemmataceae bacterium]|nr:serpin family protein [Gemmataceae bacterium]
MHGFTMGVLAAVVLAAILAADGAGRAAEVPAADKAAVVKGDNEFALDLYAKLRAQEGNLFLSPASIATALAMTYGGARGETAEQMAKALHFTLPPDRLHPAFAALLKEINTPGKERGYQLSTANALWGQKGYHFLPGYLKLTRDNYGAGLNEVDFAGNTEGARKTINLWVEKETHDKIKDLIKPGMLDGMTRLVLTNAIYFKGDWVRKFKKERTREEPFFAPGGKQVKTPLMHETSTFKYLDGGTFQALELPYKGRELSMVVLLPKKNDGLPDLEKQLTAARLNEWLGKLRPEEVNVTLPRFKMTAEFQLSSQLSALGMKRAFSKQADFSGMNGGQEPLFISDVIHKAFVDVNEEGTEAAAATAVIVRATSAQPHVPPTFRADHPFVFLIRDNRSGSLLFLGRLVNPQP